MKEIGSVRNTIEVINKGKCVYASFPCPIDMEHDYLLLEDVSKLIFLPKRVGFLNNATAKKCIENVSFSISFNEEKDPVNAKMVANFDGCEGEEFNIEIQDLVDTICSTVYDNKGIDDSEFIYGCKTFAIEELTTKCFIEKGRVILNNSYNVVGRIIDKDDKVAAIINSFYITEDKNSEDICMELEGIVSHIPIKDIEISKIEFITEGQTFIVEDFTLIKSMDGLIKEATIRLSKCTTKESTEKIIATSNKLIDNREKFFDEMSALLPNKQALIDDIYKEDCSGDEFEDFEF